ncbi:MAG TPA: HDIG domain-containing protein [Candidatus Aminicenantes bacterium]|nr:HDIG domain-containing protein [Candidatus Aminicenantes bacterium]HRY66247.1 HDIG domain-containing protein [Candidatus Aminicenantes bacterium]HRZ73161.1 HDIG domain-containing protein [Candidatus Aminicenantes bacterium]
MPASFFDKIKFFRAAEIQPGHAGAEPAEDEPKPPLPRRLLWDPWPLVVQASVLIALLLTQLPSAKNLSGLKLGEVAPADVVAPFDLTIEDAAATARKRAEADAAVIPVYTFDLNVFANTEDKIRAIFADGRAWAAQYPENHQSRALRARLIDKHGIDLETADVQTLARLQFPIETEEELIGLVTRIFDQGIVVSKNLFIHGEEKGLTLLDTQGRERPARIGDLLDISESERRFNDDLGRIEMPARNRAVLANLGQIFLTANVTYNKIETEKRKAQARDAVGAVVVTVKKDRVIVRKGDEVTADELRILGNYNQRMRGRSSWLPTCAGTFLLYLFLFSTLWAYARRTFKPKQAERQFRMTALALIVSLIFYKLFLALAGIVAGALTGEPFSQIEAYYGALPWQAATLIFAFLMPDPMTLMLIIMNSVTGGLLLGGNFIVTIVIFVGGLASVYGVRLYRRRYRAATLRAGFVVLPAVNALLVLVFHLILRHSGLASFPFEVGMGIVGGIASGILAYLFLPLVESAFGFVTAAKLLELTNSDLPIFRQMQEEAPGSYHHSLIVATLAEKAAEELGLDTQMAKAGALYHDIGKTKMPEYFIENRTREFDLHKDLTPSMSTLVIKNHVKEGAELARKLRLPRALREIIEQHHGNSLVRYFYAKAKQTYDPEEQTVGEESYRYPGPAPQTKEAGLVMLADSIEAASRSLKSPTKDNLKRVITDIINGTLQDGQLDACDFSLRELRTVAAAFLTILYAIYHPRVEYPGFSFEGRPAGPGKAPRKNNKKANDHDHQPPDKTPGSGQGV